MKHEQSLADLFRNFMQTEAGEYGCRFQSFSPDGWILLLTDPRTHAFRTRTALSGWRGLIPESLDLVGSAWSIVQIAVRKAPRSTGAVRNERSSNRGGFG